MDDFEKARRFFVEGLRLLSTNHLQAAEQQFAHSLELLPNRLSTLNNLAAVKLKLKKFSEAEEFARRATAAEASSPEAWANLGSALSALQRQAEAVQAFGQALACDPAYLKAWLGKAMTFLEWKKLNEALLACDQAQRLGPRDPEVLYVKSLILKELAQADEAQKFYVQSLELRFAASPVFIAERKATQQADILILSHDPHNDGSLTSFDDLHRACQNFPGQLARIFRDEFHFTFAFHHIAARPSARKQIPRPDLLVNNCANGDLILAEGSLSGLTELVDDFGAPVINHPAKAVQSTRGMSAQRLAEVPGVVVPKTVRFCAAGKSRERLVREIEEQFAYPLITRTLHAQEGRGMSKVDSREALLDLPAASLPEDFYVSQFVDSRGQNPFFRKLRAVVVADEIILVRADYSTHWNVRGRKRASRVQFYLDHPQVLEEEKRICADPAKELGQPALQALRALRERIPLDAFGVDFDVDREGRLVFYEANATMNLFSTAQKAVPNPQAAEDRLRSVFRGYLSALARRP